VWLKTFVEDRRAQRLMRPANFYQGCIYAWNAYRDGKQITTIKSDTRKGLYAVAE
jgi:hypothetical protein